MSLTTREIDKIVRAEFGTSLPTWYVVVTVDEREVVKSPTYAVDQANTFADRFFNEFRRTHPNSMVEVFIITPENKTIPFAHSS